MRRKLIALIRWGNDLYDPFYDFERLQDEINELFTENRRPGNQGLFDRNKVEASLENGVLLVTLHLKEAEKPKKITVKAG